MLALVLPAACGPLERTPPASVAGEVKRVTFEVVARDNRCEPEVLAADREGRAVLVTFQVVSVGKSHLFVAPDLGIRREVPAGTRVEIPVLADRSGIYRYACTSFRWIGPLTAAGKLAIR
jgi:hypothetical protein